MILRSLDWALRKSFKRKGAPLPHNMFPVVFLGPLCFQWLIGTERIAVKRLAMQKFTVRLLSTLGSQVVEIGEWAVKGKE